MEAKLTDIIESTLSLCPHCLQTLPATVHVREGRVYLYRRCPQHGEFDVCLWPDAASYRWFGDFVFPAEPRAAQTDSAAGCPRDCGLCSQHRRHTTIAEIEVTWRCNLRCPVCFMASPEATPGDPSLQTIAGEFDVIRTYDGVDTPVQITGGEPTIRADLPAIIALGRKAGFRGIELNTNGLVIARSRSYLRALKEAGLSEIYLQFDGLTADVTRTLRGADLLTDKLQALENCRREGVPVVLAMTVVAGINENQLGEMVDFALRNADIVCGLSLQPAFRSGRFAVPTQGHLSTGDMVNLVAVQTGGRIAARDFWPLGCCHPRCSCATYLVGDADTYVPFTRTIDRDTYRAYFSRTSPQGAIFTDILAQMHGGVLPKGLPVLIMGLMDAWIMDLNKLQQCSLTVVTPAGRSVPFCAYHLTDAAGRRLHPAGGGRTAGAPSHSSAVRRQV